MKKLVVLAVVVTLALPALAMAANPTPGKYTCTITSVLPELNGQNCTADIATAGTKTEATVKYKDGTSEKWTWDNATLNQTEFDKTGTKGQTYGATFADGKYKVNCVSGKCDANIDSRNYWTIDANPFIYKVYGVNKDKQSDKNATASLRHTFTFTKAN